MTTRRQAQLVEILVQDNGCGIDSQRQLRIFDPFFTTKSVGAGTGQGLAICRKIVRGYGGDICVTTQPGAGATFCVTLPLQIAS